MGLLVLPIFYEPKLALISKGDYLQRSTPGGRGRFKICIGFFNLNRHVNRNHFLFKSRFRKLQVKQKGKLPRHLRSRISSVPVCIRNSHQQCPLLQPLPTLTVLRKRLDSPFLLVQKLGIAELFTKSPYIYVLRNAGEGQVRSLLWGLPCGGTVELEVRVLGFFPGWEWAGQTLAGSL